MPRGWLLSTLTETRMDFLLISAPVANFGQATSGLSVLTSSLRAHGWDAHQWDLAIDAFHHFHSREYLTECREILEQNPQNVDPGLLQVAARTIAEIDAAKKALQTPGVEKDPGRMGRALETIHDAGVVITAASLGEYRQPVFGVLLGGGM